MDVILFLLALCPSFALCQVAPSQNVQSACAQAGRISVSQCFKSNGSFQMTDVISLLSNRTQRPLSLNSDQMRRRICQNQSEIIICMSKSINGLQNTQHCSTQNDFKRLEQETVGFINRIQTTCGHDQVLCTSLADCQVIATQRNQTHATCAPAGRNAVAMCFQSNGGFKMQNVITLLSNGSQETLPTVVSQLRENMCSNLQNITICVLSRINDLHEKQGCSSAKDILEQDAWGLIEGIRKICGQEVVSSSTSTPCLPDINNAMQICFSKVGLNPNLFDSYETKFPDAVIGENEEMAHLFCRIRPRLFECLQRTPDDCPEAEYTMASNGFDRKSMEKATNILCLDVDLYIKGLNCFRNTTVQTDSCSDRTHDQGTNQIDRQQQMPMTEETGFQKLCMKRIKKLECRLRVWRDQCKHPNSVNLKNEIECSLLPARCIREPAIQTRLRDTCATKNFGREIRSGATSPMLTSGNIIFMILSSLMLVLGRKL